MTHQQVLWNINTAAENAAQASMDAHGEFVAAEIVWDFMRQVCHDMNGEVYGEMLSLPESMPRQFKHDYARHCRVVRDRMKGFGITQVHEGAAGIVYEVRLPMDGGEISYRTVSLSDAMTFAESHAK